MSDATKCPNCNWVYWTHSYENWGTCPQCGSKNDFWKGDGKPELVGSKHIFTYYDELLEKAKKVVKNDERRSR
jgi:rubredoxin